MSTVDKLNSLVMNNVPVQPAPARPDAAPAVLAQMARNEQVCAH